MKIRVYNYFSVYYCSDPPDGRSFAVKLFANLTGRQALAVEILQF